jgi:hypothetical protein
MEKAMWTLSGRRLALVAGVVLAGIPAVGQAQFITDVNSVIENQYHFFCCTSNVTVTNNFPTSAIIDDQYTATAGGIHFANRHDLVFSSDNASTPRVFNTADSFDISFDIKLEAGANSPRKEAGLIVQQPIGDSQFIVNTDAHEIVVFGGFQPFFSFNTEFGLAFNSGDTINMRMIYTGKTESNPGTFQYIVIKDGTTYMSPLKPSGAGEGGIANNTNIQLYEQGKASAAGDFERATFSNIVFGTGLTTPAVQGDYNNNGVVDAADYVLWRDGGTLANDPTPGVQPADYDFWKARFGATSGSGASAGASVPEPSGLLLAAAFVSAVIGLRRGASRS